MNNECELFFGKISADKVEGICLGKTHFLNLVIVYTTDEEPKEVVYFYERNFISILDKRDHF